MPTPPPGTSVPWAARLDPVLGRSPSTLAVVVLIALGGRRFRRVPAGRTRERTPAYPLMYGPPDGIGPAQGAYILTEKTDKQAFVASIMQAAEKGAVDLARPRGVGDQRQGGAGRLGRARLGHPAAGATDGRTRTDVHGVAERRRRRPEAQERALRLRVRDPLVGQGGGPYAVGWPRLPRGSLRHRRRHPGLGDRRLQPVRHVHHRVDPRIACRGRGAGARLRREHQADRHGPRPLVPDWWLPSGDVDAVEPEPLRLLRPPGALHPVHPVGGRVRLRRRVGGQVPDRDRRRAADPGVLSGYAGAHTGNYTDQMVNSFSSTVDSAISSYQATQTSSSSSGGGGGFSGGGGGGGGGGGSW